MPVYLDAKVMSTILRFYFFTKHLTNTTILRLKVYIKINTTRVWKIRV